MSGAIEINKLKKRARIAMEIAVRFGGVGGDHHKAWVIDQMVRALCGCTSKYDDPSDGLNDDAKAYKELVTAIRADDQDYDEGIAP